MTDALFWEIVSLLDWSKWRTDGNSDGDDSEPDELGVLEPAIRKLANLTVREICLFDEFLNWRLYTLDTREHAAQLRAGPRIPRLCQRAVALFHRRVQGLPGNGDCEGTTGIR